MSDTLEKLVQSSGLSPIFAATVMKRALQRAGLDPANVGPRDVERALPEIERALRVYLGDGAEQRVAEIRAKLAR
ncbi:MAG: hypothetical protein U0414_30735 [Polyangiaceae bacterium]